MTAYVVILNGQIVQNKPLTTSLVAALRDNPIAIAEGDNAAPRVNPQILHVRDKKATNTAGGGCTGGSAVTRALNDVVTNRINGASVAGNQITLPAGTYDCEGEAPSFQAGTHVAYFYNVTDVAVIDALVGVAGHCDTGGSYAQTHSIAKGRVTIASTKVLELRHVCASTKASDGLGRAANLLSLPEIFAQVRITKVA